MRGVRVGKKTQGGAPAQRGAALVRESMREEIVAGRLAPGMALPSHLELARRFGVSNVTVRQGLNQLAAQGFLEVRARVGTYVAARPPHLSQYALVFPFDPAAPEEALSWSKYYQALTRAAVEVQQELGLRLMVFHGIDYHTDSEDRERLLRYIGCQQLAGIVFANSPHHLHGTPIVEASGLPRVELSSGVTAPWPIVHVNEGWMEKAVAHLACGGRRRVALLLNRFDRDERCHGDTLDRLFAAHGVACPARWRQAAEWHDPQAARHCVQLLMHGRPTDRPNALLVMDDNLIEGVAAGLVAAGVRVPHDVEVIAHANFPSPVSPALPFRLLGCDLRAVLRQAMELIDRQRRGEAVAGVLRQPALWAAEVPAASGLRMGRQRTGGAVPSAAPGLAPGRTWEPARTRAVDGGPVFRETTGAP